MHLQTFLVFIHTSYPKICDSFCESEHKIGREILTKSIRTTLLVNRNGLVSIKAQYLEIFQQNNPFSVGFDNGHFPKNEARIANCSIDLTSLDFNSSIQTMTSRLTIDFDESNINIQRFPKHSLKIKFLRFSRRVDLIGLLSRFIYCKTDFIEELTILVSKAFDLVIDDKIFQVHNSWVFNTLDLFMKIYGLENLMLSLEFQVTVPYDSWTFNTLNAVKYSKNDFVLAIGNTTYRTSLLSLFITNCHNLSFAAYCSDEACVEIEPMELWPYEIDLINICTEKLLKLVLVVLCLQMDLHK
eukprot:gnl/MRDRNA2_/MRDRNA2_84721_c0_seq1.p1 gnl/MRDRNA2_/MRDRNA2_84721_c0~~gnl/MRDRNA2_/MRDRNA2_84721_c0_seq1.p1  ORF type:complete len:299 (+),score=-18.66 gnl/MRDRNA2_/MRDRNA2_84721_c0_seq1:262-1158(+)